MTQVDIALVKPIRFSDPCMTPPVVPNRRFSLTGLRTLSASTLFPNDLPINCDALIIGCGVAGNAAALKLANKGVKVTMISAADDPHHSASYWAQGGIIYKSDDDTPALLASDIHRAGAGVCDDAAVQKLATEGPACVEELLLEASKVPFTTLENGNLALTLEASHNRARILYKADHTGKAITISMIQAVQAHPLITLVTGRSAFELLKNDATGQCIGVLTVTKEGLVQQYRAPFTLLATGGAGDLYRNTSNPDGARGEGIAIAARAGAKLKNMQYMQFHPTTLCIPGERRFLLTEALRGEGAILRDRQGRAFAKDYHAAGELAPRDVVARLILAEMAKQQEPCMFLDISHEKPEYIKNRFPTIYQHCLARGIDMAKTPLPVVPAAHYHCGGVEVDLNGCTSIPGLYAAGEVSCTGVHGANRLASTSLLEGLVWGAAAADHFVKMRGVKSVVVDEEMIPVVIGEGKRMGHAKEVEELVQAMQEVMWNNIGPLRTVHGMMEGVHALSVLEMQAEKLYRECQVSKETTGLRNAVRAAKEIALGALHAPVSVGTHFIVQEPEPEL